jgi:hypothetical protein
LLTLAAIVAKTLSLGSPKAKLGFTRSYCRYFTLLYCTDYPCREFFIVSKLVQQVHGELLLQGLSAEHQRSANARRLAPLIQYSTYCVGPKLRTKQMCALMKPLSNDKMQILGVLASALDFEQSISDLKTSRTYE